eukprot:4336979-Pyramimonas_sp.AAC.1
MRRTRGEMGRGVQHGGMELSGALHGARSLHFSIACSMPTLQSDPNDQCTLVAWCPKGKFRPGKDSTSFSGEQIKRPLVRPSNLAPVPVGPGCHPEFLRIYRATV